MQYTKEQVRAELEKAVQMLKDNPNCNISEEELLSRYTKLSSEENLEILALLMGNCNT